MAQKFTRVVAFLCVLLTVTRVTAFMEQANVMMPKFGPPRWLPWPKNTQEALELDVQAAYTNPNLTRVDDAVKCLIDWCEDDGNKLWKAGGKVRCATKHREGHNVAAWICNLSDFQQSCTRRMINNAVRAIEDGAQAQGASEGDVSGVAWYSSKGDHHFLVGVDRYCDGDSGCGRVRDTVLFCDDLLDQERKGRRWKKWRFLNLQVRIRSRWDRGMQMRKPIQAKLYTNTYGGTEHLGNVAIDDSDDEVVV